MIHSIKYKYAVKINNQFIFPGDEDILDTYEGFIGIHSEITRILVHLIIKKNTMCPSTDFTVYRAREYTNIEYRAYEYSGHKTNKHNNTESQNTYTKYVYKYCSRYTRRKDQTNIER